MKYSLVVFDLDFTLWNAAGTWCDQTLPPYRKVNNHIQDSENNIITLYPDTRSLLTELSAKYLLGVASRTYEPDWALELMNLFDIKRYFHYAEIYPGSKTEHFYQLKNKSGIPFKEMIFFDDEQRNVEDVRRLDATAILVEKGVSRELVRKSLEIII